jgi:hypothetical protein
LHALLASFRMISDYLNSPTLHTPCDRNHSTTHWVGKILRLVSACAHLAQLCVIPTLPRVQDQRHISWAFWDRTHNLSVNSLRTFTSLLACILRKRNNWKLYSPSHEILTFNMKSHIHTTFKQMHNKAYKKIVNIPFNRCKQ